MTPEERVMKLLAQANPEPGDAYGLESDAAAYLATLEHRSDRTGESRHESARRLGRLGARRITSRLAIAAAVVIAVVSVGLVNPRQGGVTSQDLQLTEAFLEAHLGGDAAGASALMTRDAVLGVEVTNDPAEYASALEWFAATGYEWSVEPCVADAGSTGQIVCPMEWGNAWSRVLDSGPYPGEFRFTLEDGQITGFFLSSGVAREYSSVSERVDAFRVDRYGSDQSKMYESGPKKVPKLTQESIALWGQMTVEFVQESADGP